VLTRIVVFLIIFGLNLLPAFAPPTWMAMSYLGVAHPVSSPLEWGILGAVAATLGRVSLARLATTLIRHKLLSPGTLDNLEVVRQAIEKRKKLTAVAFLFFAFSPLPSNQLFISYGLTSLPLRLIAFPFFVGRLVSYTFWAFTASTAARKMDFDIADVSPYFGVYFVVSQLLLLFLIYVFTKVDWRVLFTERKLRWNKAAKRPTSGA
jgi:hypothetical protein